MLQCWSRAAVMAVVSGLGPSAALLCPRAECHDGLLPLVKTSVGFRRRYGSSSTLRSASIRREYNYLNNGRRWTIACEATGNGRDFGSQASRVVEDARRKAEKAARDLSTQAEKVFEQAKRSAAEFGKEEDLQTKLNRFAQAAMRKLEEVSYDLKKLAARLDREYQITEKAQQAFDYASEQVQSVDRQLGVGRKTKELTTSLRLKWPTYRRQFSTFLETPVGKSGATVFLLWLLVSGWFFRLILISLWVIPFLPLLISKLGKAAIVQGTCPNCGMQYVGGRNQIVTCSRCRGVVWQPRTDFSRDSKVDPQIIDIDIDPK
ncbi:hypothetical protein R1sor_019569 [Riccia sorocarpa]|uniref:Uncharacterized protein n=1 Tax=Riccia sorocarpa TaxID=122646 RepID=A0ABD3IH63_9MARC